MPPNKLMNYHLICIGRLIRSIRNAKSIRNAYFRDKIVKNNKLSSHEMWKSVKTILGNKHCSTNVPKR